MSLSLDDMIGLSSDQRRIIADLAARAEREAPEKFARLHRFFEDTHTEDRQQLSFLYHNSRPQHEAERIASLENISIAMEQTAEAGPWAVLFLYFGWMHLMVKRIVRRQAGDVVPSVGESAFVYAMF
jgi:hypothetical protein